MPLIVNTTVAAQKPNSQPTSATTPITKHPISRQASNASNKASPSGQSSLHGTGSQKSHLRTRTPVAQDTQEGDDAKWGSNFWVTLVDPQTQTSFFACPATGQVSWDPPIGNFVLPPSTEGEWWELSDESRGGLPYYYQTKTGETVWERPAGFVIPLGIIQNTALGRRLSQTTFDRFSKTIPGDFVPQVNQDLQSSTATRPANSRSSIRRTLSDQHSSNLHSSNRLLHPNSSQLTPIPGSPYATDHSTPPSPSSAKSITIHLTSDDRSKPSLDSPNGKSRQLETPSTLSDTSIRARSKSSSYTSHRPQQPQSLDAALEKLSTSHSDNGHDSSRKDVAGTSYTSDSSQAHDLSSTPNNSPPASLRVKSKRDIPPSPQRPIPSTPNGPTVGGKAISKPVINHVATLQMSPVKNRATGKPIAVEPKIRMSDANASVVTFSTGAHPTLPQALVSDIQQFSESEFARQYFSTHRSGFIFRRRIPVAQLMTWQKAPLSSPLLVLNRSLQKDAVKIFKVIQHIMGDREREKSVGVRLQPDNHLSMVNSINASSISLVSSAVSMLEEERWVLGEALLHGELRDEIYCQVMKQLTGNSNTESVFKGWQFFCVLLITFPPSKNFETYLQAFIQKHTTHQEGRVDVMAKYCLRRLASISKKGPRGKPPTSAEIETAADAAFNPSTFGESLDAIIRLQERNYPHQKVPIILPFLADGILALGGPRAEGIFRVPGDNDSVSELKLRIDRGYYTLDSVDDPHVLASLMKLWLRELCDPLIPSELYNECLMSSKDPHTCVQIIQRLPTINRRVILFVVSFLQLFLEEKIQIATKMTPANLALVMAPNLLRCNSDSMSVVFTNAQYEQIFVYNLLLHLNCHETDTNYRPVHGLGAVGLSAPKSSKARSRRPNP